MLTQEVNKNDSEVVVTKRYDFRQWLADNNYRATFLTACLRGARLFFDRSSERTQQQGKAKMVVKATKRRIAAYDKLLIDTAKAETGRLDKLAEKRSHMLIGSGDTK